MTEYSPVSTYNDLPTLDCRLDRVKWRNKILHQIKMAVPPKVIAIHGTWGMGKTSVLWQLYRDLGGTHELFSAPPDSQSPKAEQPEVTGVRAIWFEAWQYQHEPNILAALLKEIRDQLSIPHKIWQGIKEGAVVGTLSLLESIGHTFDNFAGIFGGISVGSKGLMTKIKENTQDYHKQRFSTPLDSVMLKKQLQDAIGKLLNLTSQTQDVKKAVIFIDDLDRCEPEVAYRILEAIKVYLNLNNCVFVLGMDINAVDNIIAYHYQKDVGESLGMKKNRARLYLEKICQDIYPLPVPNHKQRGDLLKKLLSDKVPDDKLLNETLLQIIYDYEVLPPFPRSIKIFANVLLTFYNELHIKEFLKHGEQHHKEFLILSYLYAFHIEIYNLCISYGDFYAEFLRYCKAPEIDDSENHPELSRLMPYIPQSTVEDVMGAQSAERREQMVLIRSYPHENLRQVLWIRRLVTETGSIESGHIEILQL